MKVSSAVSIVCVSLFVLLSSGYGEVTTSLRPASVNNSEESSGPMKLKDLFSFLSSVAGNLMATNFVDFLPHPIRTPIFLVKEVFNFTQKIHGNLPEILSKPENLIRALPYILALVLIVTSLIPPIVLPTKLIAFLLSILGLFSDYFAPFDSNYLSQL